MNYIVPNNVELTDIQHFQRLDKYSNHLWDEGRVETWEEVVTRAVDVLRYLSNNRLEDEIYQRMFELGYKLEVNPSMRLLSMPMDAIKRCNTVLYNCTYGLVDTPKIFAEAQYLSMSGCGVAWSVEKKNVDKLPVVDHLSGIVVNHTVEDSQVGWAESTLQLIECLYGGIDVELNYTNIRPCGAPLKTKGGYASGPQPLIDYHKFIRKTFKAAQGRKLTTLECHDLMCYALESGISGATRRSAGLALFDKDDTLLLNCKYHGFWNDSEHAVRANANNSLVWNGAVTEKDIENLTLPWFNGLGEPGLFKRDNVINTSPNRREFLHPEYVGTNPCFIEGTMVQTKNGHFPIETLVGKPVDIWNGEVWQTIDNFRITGENQHVYTVTLHDGSEIIATPYHSFILDNGERKQLKDLTVGDKLMISEAPNTHGNKNITGAYLKGFLLGDGTINDGDKAHLWLYEPKFICEDRLIKSALELEYGNINTNAVTDISFSEAYQMKTSYRKTMRGLAPLKEDLFSYVIREYGLPQEIFESTYESKLEFIAGLFDADGTASDSKNGWLYQYSSIHLNLLQDIQLLLKTIGVQSALRLSKTAGRKDFNDGYGEYNTNDCYRLTISQESSIILSQQVTFTRLVSFANKQTTYKLQPRWNKVADIQYYGQVEKVYCCTVEGSHQFSLSNGIDIGQCGEIYLQAIPVDSEFINGGGWQFCNLSTINARPEDTLDTLKEKAYYATLIGGIQSLATDFQFIRSGTKIICDKDRLLGVNLNNFALAPIIRDPGVMLEVKRVVNLTDLEFSNLFNVPNSAAQTSNKPAGNGSLLCYTGPGGNPVHSEFQKRNVTVNKNSGMHSFLTAQGVPSYEYPGRDYASLFTFPIAYKDAITLENCSAIEQLENWKLYKMYWCEHNPSCSITYKESEIDLIKEWLFENQDIISGLAFFPEFHAYELAPIVPISEDEYNQLMFEYPKINWDNYYMYETGNDDRQKSVECAGGECIVVYG
jgi:DNA-binding transcriptional regulator WhiA